MGQGFAGGGIELIKISIMSEYMSRIWGLGVPQSVVDRYNEPHRFYHNWSHIDHLLRRAIVKDWLTDNLLLAIVYHDVVYNPKANDNEEESAALFEYHFTNEEVRQAILDTKTHVFMGLHGKQSITSQRLCSLDMEIIDAPMADFVEFEKNIFKEYQFADYNIYKEKRIEVLQQLGTREDYINYVKFREPTIAIYAGSFNPFHKGHLNILEKAERIFDKVIIAKGQNPNKEKITFKAPDAISNRQIVTYDGLLTDFIDGLGYPVTLIRGLRNSSDLEHEQVQYRYFQDFKPDIKVVSIFCDNNLEHISSSAIRQLEAINVEHDYSV